MKKEIEITVPTDYSAVSLKKYLKIQEDLETYKDDKEAEEIWLKEIGIAFQNRSSF